MWPRTSCTHGKQHVWPWTALLTEQKELPEWAEPSLHAGRSSDDCSSVNSVSLHFLIVQPEGRKTSFGSWLESRSEGLVVLPTVVGACASDCSHTSIPGSSRQTEPEALSRVPPRGLLLPAKPCLIMVPQQPKTVSTSGERCRTIIQNRKIPIITNSLRLLI